ncbi:MAG: hypothetical protein CO189_04015 [candidate division Zixibacteria bacterium CG_4_9_14_3_um_filter_46_8]|nr:MAG: hypothetical protein CO189_04015 [candidate division Zixibacteria bacterium CG_4_9_14_3_um_filter_46_8]
MYSKYFISFRGLAMVVSRTAILLFLAVAILSTYGCSPKKPEAPTWDTQWSLPLSSKTYSIQEIVDELGDENIIFDENGDPKFEITESIDTFQVGENLTVSGMDENFAEELGQVEIDAPQGESVETSLSEFLTVNLGVVPPAAFSFGSTLNPYNEFSWATIAEGKLYVLVANQLEVDLDTLTVSITDDSNGNLIGTILFSGGIPYGQTKIDSLDLAGKTIHNQLSTQSAGYTPGGVLLNLGPQKLTVTSSFSNQFRVSSASAKTPEITKDFSKQIESTDSTLITSASVQSGTIVITVENKTNLTSNISIIIPNLTDESGQLALSGTMGGGQTVSLSRDLAGYTIRPDGLSFPQIINTLVSASIQSSGDQYLEIDQFDSILVTSALSALSFYSVTGEIKPTQVEIDPTSREIEIPEGMDQAKLTGANMYLHFYNNSEIEADLNLVLSGNNAKSMPISGRIQGRTPGSTEPSLSTITVGPDQMSGFLDPAPTQIDITGNALFNPEIKNGTISQTDLIYGEIQISSPLAFSIKDTATVDLEIESQEISEDAPNFEEKLKYAIINADLDSHLPIGAEVTIYISTIGDSTMYTDPQAVVIGPMYLDPAPVDNDGMANGEASSSFVDSLTSAEAGIFNNKNIYIGKIVRLYTPDDGSGVTIRSSDYIRISASAFAEVRTGGN